jgi:hypothetical protein
MSRRARRTQIAGQWAAHRIDMLRSPAWRALSLSARRILDRLEIEHASHGGAENGRLPVTYEQFHQYGIHRHAIAPAIREAIALGFIEVTQRGRAGNAEFRKPNYFRLTYFHTKDPPTDEWMRITEEAAEAMARAARSASASKTKSQCRKTPVFDDGNRHRKQRVPVPETITTAPPPETVTTCISRGGDGEHAVVKADPPLACSRSAPHSNVASEHAGRPPDHLNGHSPALKASPHLERSVRAHGWALRGSGR